MVNGAPYWWAAYGKLGNQAIALIRIDLWFNNDRDVETYKQVHILKKNSKAFYVAYELLMSRLMDAKEIALRALCDLLYRAFMYW